MFSNHIQSIRFLLKFTQDNFFLGYIYSFASLTFLRIRDNSKGTIRFATFRLSMSDFVVSASSSDDETHAVLRSGLSFVEGAWRTPQENSWGGPYRLFRKLMLNKAGPRVVSVHDAPRGGYVTAIVRNVCNNYFRWVIVL